MIGFMFTFLVVVGLLVVVLALIYFLRTPLLWIGPR